MTSLIFMMLCQRNHQLDSRYRSLAIALFNAFARSLYNCVYRDIVDRHPARVCRRWWSRSVMIGPSIINRPSWLQEQTGFQKDEDLIQEINSKLPSENDLRVKVDNGAVFLSGSVKDETTARTIIKQVEAIPGVHWITVELALTNQSQPILG